MMGEGENWPLTDKHRVILGMVKDLSDPVTHAGELLEDPRGGFESKPSYLKHLDELREHGYLDRKEVGPVYAYWPAGKYDGMARKIDQLQKEREQVKGRIGYLQEERDGLREQLDELQAELSAKDRASTSPISEDRFLVPGFPTELPEELEQRWRIRANAWRRSLGRIGTVIAMLVIAIVALFLLRPTLTSSVPGLDVGSVNAGLGLLIVISFLALGPAVLYLVAQGLAIGALVSPTFGRWADTPVRFFERHIGNGVPGEGEGPTGTDRVLTEVEE